MKQFYTIFFTISSFISYSQIGIGTTTPTAALEIASNTNGIVIPRIALTSKNVAAPVVNPQGGVLPNGTLIWNTATAGTVPNNISPGFYYWNAGMWNAIGGSATRDWSVDGNAIADPVTEFIGTTSNQDFRIRTNNAARFDFTTNGRLRAYDNGTAAQPTYSWIGASASTTGMFRPAANAIAFSTSSTERLRLWPNGQVSINTGTVFTGDQFSVVSTGSAINGYGNETGVYGQSTIANGVGVYGLTQGTNTTGVIGTTNASTGSGMYSRNLNVGGTGIMSSGNNIIPMYLTGGSGGAFTGNRTGIYSYYPTSGNGEGMVIQDSYTAQWNVGAYNGGMYYKIIGNGTVSTVVKDLNDKNVVMHCTETPAALFEDYGIGKLVNGKATIHLDPILSKNIKVSDEFPMKVFIQLEGDCNGVFVTNKTAESFDVIELQNGNSNVSFSYSVVANRADETYTSATGNQRTAVYSARFSPAPEYQTTTTSKISTTNIKQ